MFGSGSIIIITWFVYMPKWQYYAPWKQEVMLSILRILGSNTNSIVAMLVAWAVAWCCPPHYTCSFMAFPFPMSAWWHVPGGPYPCSALEASNRIFPPSGNFEISELIGYRVATNVTNSAETFHFVTFEPKERAALEFKGRESVFPLSGVFIDRNK